MIYRLGSKALQFAYNSLQSGAELSRQVITKHEYLGTVQVDLPDDTPEAFLEEYKYGGIGASKLLLRFVPLVTQFLLESVSHVAVAENQSMVPGPPVIQGKQFFSFRDNVYFFRTGNDINGEHSVEKLFKEASNYPSNIFLTSSLVQISPRQEITDKMFAELADNIRYILVGAYDEEGKLLLDIDGR
jgi:hypothetical protein